MGQLARVAFIQSQVAAMNAELEGMLAQNREDLAADRPPSFSSDQFFNLPGNYQLFHNQVIGYLS